MKTESILAALLEIQEQGRCSPLKEAIIKSQKDMKASVDTLVAMLKKELEGM